MNNKLPSGWFLLAVIGDLIFVAAVFEYLAWSVGL